MARTGTPDMESRRHQTRRLLARTVVAASGARNRRSGVPRLADLAPMA